MPEKDHSADVDRQALVNRARSIQGHMGAVVRMIEEDAYCVDIIKQTQAVEKAIDRLNSLLLEGHLNHCVTTALRSKKPSERERVISELLEVFETANKAKESDQRGKECRQDRSFSRSRE